jgi:hypothetical protein
MRGEQEERWKRRRRGHTLNVTSRLSPSSNTVDLTCFPSSIKVMPTYNETLSINLNTPSARITKLLASSRVIAMGKSACDASSKDKGRQEEGVFRKEEQEKEETYLALEISHLQISRSISKRPHPSLSILHLIA